MASFGRRPAKGTATTPGQPRTKGAESEAYKRLKEEIAERERFAKEYEECKKNAPDSDDSEERPPPQQDQRTKLNPHVFMKVEILAPDLLGRSGKVEASGRLEFELFADIVPKTAENFRCLCTGEQGRELAFEGSTFHRIIPGFMAQGGDITDGDGSGGRSIYGRTFADEGFSRRHEERGMLSMANSGPGTNGSQFFVLFKPAPHLDRKHVVFGRMVGEEGQILRRMEERGSKSGDVKGQIVVVACGQMEAPPPQRNPPPVRQDTQQRGRERDRGRERSRSAGRAKGCSSRSRSGQRAKGRALPGPSPIRSERKARSRSRRRSRSSSKGSSRSRSQGRPRRRSQSRSRSRSKGRGRKGK
mmetsp:Transcript_51183/g.115051  ORF Transcript_51183/g.115051 Transcript_51183/m.115051 type:complete len:359 (+) Transcript_51183:36-1112(+)